MKICFALLNVLSVSPKPNVHDDDDDDDDEENTRKNERFFVFFFIILWIYLDIYMKSYKNFFAAASADISQ
jgi:hypothetical protein